MPRVLAEFIEHILDEMNYLDRNAQKISKEAFSMTRHYNDPSFAVLRLSERPLSRFLNQRDNNIHRSNGAICGHEGSLDSQLFWRRLRNRLGCSS